MNADPTQPAPGVPAGNRREEARYAIIFRTHFWDSFTERQLASLKAVTHLGDIHVLVDETNGPVSDISHPQVFRVTSQQFTSHGYAAAGEGSLLWFNGDYPLYAFKDAHPEYDYYLQLEYDVVINTRLDQMIQSARVDGVDYVGLTKGPPAAEWHWLDTCLGSYRLADIKHQLICLSLFSGRALNLLKKRRLEMSELWASEQLKVWPMCEAFIATEISLGGLKSAELSRFGDVTSYDHWPPYLEDDPKDEKNAFVHPVLDHDRYVASIFKYQISLFDFFNPTSVVHEKLSRLPLHERLALVFRDRLPREFVKTVSSKLPGGRRAE